MSELRGEGSSPPVPGVCSDVPVQATRAAASTSGLPPRQHLHLERRLGYGGYSTDENPNLWP